MAPPMLSNEVQEIEAERIAEARAHELAAPTVWPIGLWNAVDGRQFLCLGTRHHPRAPTNGMTAGRSTSISSVDISFPRSSFTCTCSRSILICLAIT